MSYLVGLTGGIGSGKSTVAELFARRGVPVIDTDLISHQLTRSGGDAIAPIRHAFGDDYIDGAGAMDRSRMRQRVFADPQARQLLESILHPLILDQTRAQMASIPAPYVLLVVPLLFESADYRHWLNRTVVVDCAEDAQVRRATSRSGLSETVVRAIMSQQLSRAQRTHLADDIIQNDGEIYALEAQVGHLHQQYLDLAERSN
jgi:dephospho-CoA kinase